MRNLFKYLIVIKLIFISYTATSYANVTGTAAKYEVTMRKVEMCTGSTGITNCDNAVVLGTGDKAVDIAAVDAGAAAGSYGDPALLPLGETYTHMRVTIDRKFVIKSGEQLDPSGAASGCVTQAVTDSMYDSDEATDKYTHKVSVTDDTALSSAADMNVYLENDSYTLCASADCSTAQGGQTNDYSSPSYATYQSTHDSDTSDDHVMVYKLTTPYTVTLIPPVIDISFGTQDAVGAFTVSASRCAIYGAEPVVTITVK
tara:strand:- start:109 stop:882 length:774 start_codon:yes stop_codon:yes gene_type:complete